MMIKILLIFYFTFSVIMTSQDIQKWKNFNHVNSSMQNNFDWVSSFGETNSNKVIIGTSHKIGGYRGCGLFMYENGSIEEIANYEITRASADIVKDNNGDLWIADALGLFKLSSDKLEKYDPDNSIIPLGTFTAIEIEKNGKIFLGSYEGELIVIEDNISKTYNQSNSILNGGIIHDLLLDKNGKLFIGTDGGLYVFDNNEIVKMENSYKLISTLAFDTNDDLWIGSYLSGVQMLRGGNFIEIILPQNEVSSIVIDSDRNKWIGTRGYGLFIYNFYNGFVSVIKDTINSEIASNNIQTLFFDKSDNLWIGTFDNGLSIYNETGIISDVELDDLLNKENFYLNQNYPNPFNPSTRIKFSIPKKSFVTVKIYNILGREVVTLMKKEKVAGHYELEFNASNFASGVYFYRIQAGDFVETKKMILLR